MKIKIYTLTTNDDGQMDTQFFDTEEAQVEEVKSLMRGKCGAEFDKLLILRPCELSELYFIAQEDYGYGIDLHWTEHEIEVPTEPVNAELLAVAKLWASRLEGFDDVQIAKRSDPWTIDAHKRTMDAIAAAEAGQGEPLRVVVEVSGGVAEVTSCPPGVDVEIIDHDNGAAERDMQEREC